VWCFPSCDLAKNVRSAPERLLTYSSSPRAPPPHEQLIGDSGVGKSCLLLRFAVRSRPRIPHPASVAQRRSSFPSWPWASSRLLLLHVFSLTFRQHSIFAGRHLHGELHLDNWRGLRECPRALPATQPPGRRLSNATGALVKCPRALSWHVEDRVTPAAFSLGREKARDL